MQFTLIIIFCSLSILFSALVISSRNPIHSILFLILVFCCVAFVLLILGIEFLAISILIVYVGAIAVLFLFVVMMLNIKIIELEESFWKYISIGFIISLGFLYQIFYTIIDFSILLSFLGTERQSFMFVEFDGETFMIQKNDYEFNLLLDNPNAEVLGQLIYTFNFPIFFIISWILLIAMIGAIVLVLNQNINVKRQKIFRQTLRNLKSCVAIKK